MTCKVYDPAATPAMLAYLRNGGTITKLPPATPEWQTQRYLESTHAERFFARMNRAPFGRRVIPQYLGR